MDELQTLIDYSRYWPSIDPVFECRSGYYWSSSTYVYDPDRAWFVGFHYGGVGASNKSYDVNYVRCVRSGP